MEWKKPLTYGDAAITGYKVYVNGVVEGLLAPDQLSFSFTHGKWCREYVFQVQVREKNTIQLLSSPFYKGHLLKYQIILSTLERCPLVREIIK